MTQTTSRPPTEVSPLPSRALHTSPSSTSTPLTSELVQDAGPVMLRKHPKQSLSQPTIPEEGPEVEQELEHAVTSVLKPKPESRVVKNLAQEAFGSSSGSSPSSNVKKSNSFKEEKNSENNSPKLTRTESIGERTMQKISKVIRGTSRSDSRSKKSREASLSPQGKTNKKEASSKEKREQYKASGGGQ